MNIKYMQISWRYTSWGCKRQRGREKEREPQRKKESYLEKTVCWWWGSCIMHSTGILVTQLIKWERGEMQKGWDRPSHWWAGARAKRCTTWAPGSHIDEWNWCTHCSHFVTFSIQVFHAHIDIFSFQNMPTYPLTMPTHDFHLNHYALFGNNLQYVIITVPLVNALANRNHLNQQWAIYFYSIY